MKHTSYATLRFFNMIYVIRKIQTIPCSMQTKVEKRNHHWCLFKDIRGNVLYKIVSIRLLHLFYPIVTYITTMYTDNNIIDFFFSNIKYLQRFDDPSVRCRMPFIDHFERCPVRATARIAFNRESCRYIDSAIFRSIDNKSD